MKTETGFNTKRWLQCTLLLLAPLAFAHVPEPKFLSRLDDVNQTLAASYRYDPYGNTTYSSGSLAAANVYRFSSKEVHLNSGLYAYGYRFYSPNWQRWLNQDPIGEWGGINLYGFVGNNPIYEIDPLGLAWYNPFSWNWNRIGSAVEAKYGGELGLAAEAKLSKLEGELGAEYGMGHVFNLGGGKYGKNGVYNEARTGLFLKCGKYQAGLGKEWEMQNYGNRDPWDEHIYRVETTNSVFGVNARNVGADSSDWTTLRIGATLVAVHGEVSVNFGRIWDGITK